MLMPSLFARDLFDEVFDSRFHTYHQNNNLMKTDVRETDSGYELLVDLPGIKKEDLTAELKDGYLTISATTSGGNDEQDANGRYIRRERFSGTFSRKFYVGEAVTQEDIKAKFEDGTLTLQLPKKELAPQLEAKNYIAIEG